MVLGDLYISGYEKKIYCKNKEDSMELSATEFSLLSYFAQNPRKAVSREECLMNVWGIDADVETRVVDETIRKIRKK